jgi:hypothetical protein
MKISSLLLLLFDTITNNHRRQSRDKREEEKNLLSLPLPLSRSDVEQDKALRCVLETCADCLMMMKNMCSSFFLSSNIRMLLYPSCLMFLFIIFFFFFFRFSFLLCLFSVIYDSNDNKNRHTKQ